MSDSQFSDGVFLARKRFLRIVQTMRTSNAFPASINAEQQQQQQDEITCAKAFHNP
jgi:hypothetical protein